MITMLIFVLSSCNREDSHIVIPIIPNQQNGAAIIGFNTEGVTNTKFKDTHLYGFDATQKMVMHKYYATQKELSSDMFTLTNGAYTFVAVLNVGKTFGPTTPSQSDANMQTKADVPLQEVSLNRLLSYIKQTESKYPDMLTGMINSTVNTDEVVRIEIPLADRSGGIPMTIVTANITLPDAEFTEYQNARTKTTAPHQLRGIAEFYHKGTNELVNRYSQILTPSTVPGNYTLQAEVSNGEYDVLLWIDYTESGLTTDLWYNTNSLQAIKMIATNKSYTSGSDTRETFYGAGTITADGKATGVNINTVRPQAKYLLIADDVMRYRELMEANPDKYIPLNELSISILYESYLPDGFNVKDGRPNSSELGYKCNKEALPAVGATDSEVKIGSDYVFVNGGESSVIVTVVVTDKAGSTVSRVQGVVVKYKRNMLTTVRGDFLTAGVVNPGIDINTDWDGVHNVEF